MRGREGERVIIGMGQRRTNRGKMSESERKLNQKFIVFMFALLEGELGGGVMAFGDGLF